MKNFMNFFSPVILALTISGCTGTAMKTEQLNPSEYTVIGHAEGKATGILLFQMIPIKQNDRFVRAQTSAIKSLDGDALINTKIQESWLWAFILNTNTTTVSGDVIKFKR